MPTTNGHEVVTGCVLDGVFGWHNDARMIAVAVGLGYELDTAGQRDVDAYDTGEYTDDTGALAEVVHDIMREAEDWLNAHTTEGYLWHWFDGSFFLSPDCGREDGELGCDDDTCLCWIDGGPF